MRVNRMLLKAVGLLAAANLAQLIGWSPQLPERVASHFDPSNRPDGWMSRTAFIVLTVVLLQLMAFLFVALPLLLNRRPDSLINLPNKEHWLAPSRRAESVDRMRTGLLAIGCATLLFLFVIFQGIYTFNAELASSGAMDAAVAQLEMPLPFPVILGVYSSLVGGVVVWMLLRFRVPA